MKPQITLEPKTSKPIFSVLSRQNAAYAARFPGDFAGRQPVHTVYGGAGGGLKPFTTLQVILVPDVLPHSAGLISLTRRT